MGSKDMTMMLLLGGVAVVGGVVIFWDKICPVFNMCGLNEKIGGAVDYAGESAGGLIKGGPDDDDDEGEIVSPPPDAEASERKRYGLLKEGELGTSKCCICRWDKGNQPKCNSKIGGPWKRYRTAMKIKDKAARMQKSLDICNKHCKQYKIEGGKSVRANHAFLPAHNGRMSLG